MSGLPFANPLGCFPGWNKFLQHIHREAVSSIASETQTLAMHQLPAPSGSHSSPAELQVTSGLVSGCLPPLGCMDRVAFEEETATPFSPGSHMLAGCNPRIKQNSSWPGCPVPLLKIQHLLTASK